MLINLAYALVERRGREVGHHRRGPLVVPEGKA